MGGGGRARVLMSAGACVLWYDVGVMCVCVATFALRV